MSQENNSTNIDVTDRLAMWALLFALEVIGHIVMSYAPESTYYYFVDILAGTGILLCVMSVPNHSVLKNDLLQLCLLDVLVQIFGLTWHLLPYSDDIYVAANSAVILLKMLRILWMWKDENGFDTTWAIGGAKKMGKRMLAHDATLVLLVAACIAGSYLFYLMPFKFKAAIGLIPLAYLAVVVRVEKKTAEERVRLAEDKANLSQELADAKNALERKNAALRDASHDLRQPMLAMFCNIHALGEALGNTEKEPLRKIHRELSYAVKRLEEDLDNTIHFAKIATGFEPPTIRPVSAMEINMAMCLEFNSLAESNGLEFDVRTTDVVLLTDKNILLGILRNLLGNAIKNTGTGCVSLRIRQLSDKAWCAVEVWDTGEKHDATSFDEFHRRKTAEAKAIGKKSGLGLGIIKKLAGSIDAEIILRARAKGGSVFCVHLPIVPGMSHDDLPTAQPVEGLLKT